MPYFTIENIPKFGLSLEILIFLLDCLGNFKLVISGGYFKNGFIDKGEMSSASKCACACNEKVDCVAFGFRDDNHICYFYMDVSDLKEEVIDANCNLYIKKIPGNNSILMYFRTLFTHHEKNCICQNTT
mgnify:CR=1 FL=1